MWPDTDDQCKSYSSRPQFIIWECLYSNKYWHHTVVCHNRVSSSGSVIHPKHWHTWEMNAFNGMIQNMCAFSNCVLLHSITVCNIFVCLCVCVCVCECVCVCVHFWGSGWVGGVLFSFFFFFFNPLPCHFSECSQSAGSQILKICLCMIQPITCHQTVTVSCHHSNLQILASTTKEVWQMT